MREKIIENLINYWGKCENNYFTYDKRINLPGFKLSKNLKDLNIIDDYKTKVIIKIFSKVRHQKTNSGSVDKWNKGWGENYNDIIINKKIEPFITPYYFGKYPLSRIMEKFVIEESYKLPNDINQILNPKWDIPAIDRYNSLENNLVRLMMHNLVYLPFLKKIKENKRQELFFYEFGAGTTHNLHFLKKFIDHHIPNNNATYVALDWSESTNKIVKILGSQFRYEFINYYEPKSFPKIKKNSYIFSLASLEQLNISSEIIIKYIADSNPELVINIEPISQTLSKNSLIDSQSIEYMIQRNYLPDFLSSILRIKMNYWPTLNFNIFRSGLGSQFIDGYSVANWSIK